MYSMHKEMGYFSREMGTIRESQMDFTRGKKAMVT